MTFMDTVRRSIGGKKTATAADLAKILTAAANERDQARQRLEKLRDADAEVALDDSKWKANGAAIAEAEREVLRLDHVVASLQARLADTQAAEATAERKRRYAEADARATQVAMSIDDRLAKIARETQALLHDIAQAQREVELVNASLPPDLEPLTAVELRGRSSSARPDRFDETVVWAWRRRGDGTIVGEDVPGLIVSATDTRVGYTQSGGAALRSFDPARDVGAYQAFPPTVTLYDRVQVCKVVRFRDLAGTYHPPTLAAEISLPPVRHFHGEPAGWTPLVRTSWYAGMSTDAERTLAQLEEIERKRRGAEKIDLAPPADWGDPSITYRPLPPDEVHSE